MENNGSGDDDNDDNSDADGNGDDKRVDDAWKCVAAGVVHHTSDLDSVLQCFKQATLIKYYDLLSIFRE